VRALLIHRLPLIPLLTRLLAALQNSIQSHKLLFLMSDLHLVEGESVKAL
jgi:hypothetical protein